MSLFKRYVRNVSVAICMCMIQASLSFAKDAVRVSPTNVESLKPLWVKSVTGNFSFDINNFKYDQSSRMMKVWIKPGDPGKADENYEIVCGRGSHGPEGKFRKVAERNHGHRKLVNGGWQAIGKNDIGDSVCMNLSADFNPL